MPKQTKTGNKLLCNVSKELPSVMKCLSKEPTTEHASNYNPERLEHDNIKLALSLCTPHIHMAFN